MNKKTLLLSLTEYDFTNDDGERVQGASVYLLGDLLEDKNAHGYRVGKFSVSQDIVKDLKTVPCIVNADFDLKINAKNQPSLSIKKLDYVKSFDLQL